MIDKNNEDNSLNIIEWIFEYTMKIIILIMLPLILPTLCSAETLEMKMHKNWASMMISNGDAIASRMATPDSKKQSILVVDFYPGKCDIGVARIIGTPTVAPQPSNEKKILPGSIRVDNREIHDVTFTAYISKDRKIVMKIENASGSNIFRDALIGVDVRFKIVLPEDVIYNKYSLVGFRAAYERSQNLCRILKPGNENNKDEEYFRDTQRIPKASKNDAEYF